MRISGGRGAVDGVTTGARAHHHHRHAVRTATVDGLEVTVVKRILLQHGDEAADDLCGSKLVMAHEGGYSEVHVPFCGHAVLQEMSGSSIEARDPLGPRLHGQQPGPKVQAFFSELIDEMAVEFGL
jgi:hypothetical protein